MTQIDFYSLEPGSRGDRFLLSCRLVERILGAGLRALIYCPDGEEARHLDRLLWTYREDSFLPHGQVGQVDQRLTPILISRTIDPTLDCQVLVNLSQTTPAPLEPFARLCEVVDQEPAVRDAGRARYRRYREQGRLLRHHPINLSQDQPLIQD